MNEWKLPKLVSETLKIFPKIFKRNHGNSTCWNGSGQIYNEPTVEAAKTLIFDDCLDHPNQTAHLGLIQDLVAVREQL